jgi:hypothetical protein
MNSNPFILSQDAYNAHMLTGVMDATIPPGETAGECQVRSAAIVEMFRTFEVANAMESMIACHCIMLRFVLDGAMRDANNTKLDPAMLIRMRSSAMSISKTLHLWISKYEKLHARNETRAVEAAPDFVAPDFAVQVSVVPSKPVVPVKPPVPARPIPPRPLVTDPPRPGLSLFLMPEPAGLRLKDALLSSAAAPHGASPNGRLTVPTHAV